MGGFVIVFIGGGLGAAFRHGVNLLSARLFGTVFPWHTFIINISGAFLLGLVMALSAERGVLSNEWRLFLGVGVLGGYTTFSTLSYESIALIERGLVLNGALNMFGSAFVGLVAVVAGLYVGRVI